MGAFKAIKKKMVATYYLTFFSKSNFFNGFPLVRFRDFTDCFRNSLALSLYYY